MIFAASLFAADTNRKADDIKRIEASANTLVEIQHAKDGGIPQDLLEKAHCVGIIPAAKRAGFIVGGQYGKGIVTCRIHGSNRWSAPDMIVLEGGSFGLQIGAGETDIIMAVMNDNAERRMRNAKVEIGGDVMAAAGPLGRSVSADTNATMRAEILTWSRARGVFAGADLKGASLRSDNDDNAALYGRPVTPDEILSGKVPHPPQARALYAELERYAPSKAARTGE
ncbi:MAG TPA: lipid-binding SYLF domain-containing protein [Bryobacteraceae bacterium]|nr:lipid-binding SYLF domain-containing protein [Bryobacteraceae bacterium]